MERLFLTKAKAEGVVVASAIGLKTWRDLWIHKSQSFAVVAAITVSTITLGAILISYSLLSQAMQDNYQRSSPTMITFQLEQAISAEMLPKIGKHKDINRLELSRYITGTISNQQGTQFPLILFVVRDFGDIQLDVIDLVQGSWPTQPGQIVIEKQAMSVLQGKLGEEVTISTTVGLAGSTKIAAIGHDVSVAQAEWENIVYGYIDTDTLLYLGGQAGFEQIKVGLYGTGLNAGQIREQGKQVQQWLISQGVEVKAMRVASGEPPHSNITDGMFMMKIAFGFMCCLLSAILVVNLISAVLSKQVSQIGVMKSLGAQPQHIRQVYLRSALTLCTIGFVIGLPLAYWLARIYAGALANMMNIDIFLYGVAPWVLVVLVVFAFLVPLLSVMYPISRASKITIKKALMDFDTDSNIQIPNCLEQLLSKCTVYSNELRFSARNIFRKKNRFVLTSAVMAVAGAILMASFNVSEAMHHAVQRDNDTRLWHTRVRFDREIDKTALGLPVNGNYHPFHQSKVRLISDGPTTAHGSLSLLQLTAPEKLLRPKILSGSWLTGDSKQIVFSQLAAKAYPGYSVGDTVVLQSGASFTLVGIAEFFGSADLYTAMHSPTANGVFLTGSSGIQQREQTLNNAGILIERSTKSEQAAKVIIDHFEIIFALLLFLAAVTLLIAGKSVILTMSINTQERSREIGVLKAIGANKASLNAIILGESLWSGLVAWIVACLLTIPISALVSAWLGLLLVGVKFPLAIDSLVLILALPLMAGVSVVSAYFPARRVAAMTVREALAKL